MTDAGRKRTDGVTTCRSPPALGIFREQVHEVAQAVARSSKPDADARQEPEARAGHHRLLTKNNSSLLIGPRTVTFSSPLGPERRHSALPFLPRNNTQSWCAKSAKVLGRPRRPR